MAVERGTRTALPRQHTVARRALTRYVVRGLIVAGFAGAAWLFWSASAQAAPGDSHGRVDLVGTVPAIVDSSIVDSSIVGLVTASPAAETDAGTPLVALPAVATQAVRLAEPVAAKSGLAEGVLAEATAAVTQVVAPVARATTVIAAPPSRSASLAASRAAGETTATRFSGPRVSVDTVSTVDAGFGVTGASTTTAVPAAASVPVPHENTRRPALSGRSTASPVGDRAGPDSLPGNAQPALPARPSAPMPVSPVSGAGVIGASTGTSGSTMDGGATAVLSQRFAAGAVATHRAGSARSVAARPLTALVPTVSPD